MADLSSVPVADLLAAMPKTPETFAAQYGAAAQRASAQIGVDPSVILGQWGHETGWGKSVIPGTNNLGNIKDPTGQGPTATDNANGSKDSYAAYQSPDDFADHYANLIKTQYPGAVGSGNNVQKFTKGLAGYAEDPSYALHVAAAARSVPAQGVSIQQQQNPLEQMSTEDLMKAAGLSGQQQAAQAQAGGATGVDAAAAQQQAALAAQPPAPEPAPLTDKQKAAAAVQQGLEGGPLNELTHGIASGAANLVGGGAQLAAHGIGAGLNALNFPNAGAAVSGAGDAAAKFLNQGTPNTVAGQVGQALGSAAAPMPGAGVMRAAAGGAALGAAQPVLNPQDQYWQQKALQAGVGGAAGAAGGVLGKVIAGANLSPEARAIIAQGGTPTPGQALRGFFNTVEEKMQSVPILGDAIQAARRNAVKDMNTAAYQAVLDPIGGTAPTNVGVRDGVENVRQQLSARYDAILPQVTYRPDTQFMQDMRPVMTDVNRLPDQLRDVFNNVMSDNVLTPGARNGGALPGQQFKDAESALTQEASQWANSSRPLDRKLGQAFTDTLNNMRGALVRSNPQQAGELKSVNQAWANFKVIQNAAGRVNDPTMPIMPGQLQAAVKAGDPTLDKRAFSEAAAKMQDISDPAMAVLGQKYPDSGTPGRQALASLLSGGALALHPGLAIPAGLATVAYGTNAGRQAMLAALARRPDFARLLGGGVQQLAPAIGAGVAPVSQGSNTGTQ